MAKKLHVCLFVCLLVLVGDVWTALVILCSAFTGLLMYEKEGKVSRQIRDQLCL